MSKKNHQKYGWLLFLFCFTLAIFIGSLALENFMREIKQLMNVKDVNKNNVNALMQFCNRSKMFQGNKTN